MRKALIGLFAASLLLVANESMALTMYGGVGRGSKVNRGGLLIVDQVTGAGTLVGNPITDLELSEGLTGGLTGIAFNSAGALFGSTIIGPPGPPAGSVIRTSTLIQIDPDTGALIESIGDITVDGFPISIGDLGFQPGTDVLYGIRANADGQNRGGELYTIDTTTGVATLVGVPEADTGGGLAFSPDGTLYVARLGFISAALLTLDPTDASTISNVSMSMFFDGLAVRSDGTLFAHVTGEVGIPEGEPGFDRRGEIHTIDPTTGISTFVGITGAGFTSDLDFRPEPVPQPDSVDLDPDVFEVAVTSYGEQEMVGQEYLTAYIEPPVGVDAVDIIDTTVALSVNGMTVATAEFPAILDNLLVVQFKLTPDNVGDILGIEVINVKVDEQHNRIVVETTTTLPYDLIELTVSGDLMSGENFIGTDAVRVVPRSNQSPLAVAGSDQNVECASPAGAVVWLDGSGSTDPDGDPLTFTWTGPFGMLTGEAVSATLPMGTHNITLTVDDGRGGTASDMTVVTVHDTTRPTVKSMRSSSNVLWPPNHRMVPVTVFASVSDTCHAAQSCQIIWVSSNEPANGVGDGDTEPDWEITGDLTVNLRAERSGKRSGRVYTITVQCTDGFENSAMETMTVTVPHYKEKFKDMIKWWKQHRRK